MVSKTKGPNILNTGSFDGDDNAHNTEFRNFLRDWSKNTFNLFGSTDPLNEFDKYQQCQTPLDKRNALLHMLQGRWEDVGFPRATEVPSDAGYTFPTGSVAQPGIQYIRIDSVLNENEDGQVFYLMYNSALLKEVASTSVKDEEMGSGEGFSNAQRLVEPDYECFQRVMDDQKQISWGLYYFNQAPNMFAPVEQGTNPDEGYFFNSQGEFISAQQTFQLDAPLPEIAEGGIPPVLEPGPVVPPPPSSGDGALNPRVDGWYFCDKAIQEKISALTSECDSPTSASWSHFVKSLHTGLISLPKPPSQVVGNQLPFHPNDELVVWFRAAFGAAELFALRNNAAGDFIGGFKLSLPLNRSKSQSVVLTFSTEDDLLAKSFGFASMSDMKQNGMGDGGLNTGSTALILAVDATASPSPQPGGDKTRTPLSIPLSDIAAFAGFPDLFSKSILMSTLGSLEFQFPDLDTKPTTTACRNALWFVP